MFQQAFNALDNVFRQKPGCTTELDHSEQTSWLLFLKYLNDLEETRLTDAGLAGRPYTPIIDPPHRWGAWASPKRPDGSPDRDRALTGDGPLAYVDRQLWPYLRGFRERAESPDTIEYKIGQIFGEVGSKCEPAGAVSPRKDAGRPEQPIGRQRQAGIDGRTVGATGDGSAGWLSDARYCRNELNGCYACKPPGLRKDTSQSGKRYATSAKQSVGNT